MSVFKIAVAGGPCAGKSSALSAIESYAKERGMTVFLLRECATDLMESGITPSSCAAPLCFQMARALLQVEKERIYAIAAEGIVGDVLIVCDRGLADGKAYMSEEGWRECLARLSLSEEQTYLRYDAVFYLTSAAVGAKEAYTLANNNARSESAEEAAALDAKTFSAWKNHPQLYKIGCYPTFEEKRERILSCLAAFLDSGKGC